VSVRYFEFGSDAEIYLNRPMGIVAGLVNKENQSAGEIIKEIVGEASLLLGSANGFVNTSAKL
jgi:hypothetical protein